MKLAKIECFPVFIGNGNQLIVRLETNTGIHGWGCSGLSSRELAVVGAIDHFREFLIGKDPRRIGAIWQELYRSQYFEGGRVLAAAISAIDIALHDIKGKALGVPVYELLGGKQRDFVDCFASVAFTTPDVLIQKANTLLNAGWRTFRLNSAIYDESGEEHIFDPRESIHHTAEAINALRAAVGTRPTIGLDYHHRLTVPETVSFLQRLTPGALDFLEEPIRDETPEAYKTLRSMVDVPFAIGEEFSSKWQFRPYIETGLTQFARIDVCNVGGLTESMKVAAHAETHYIDLMPHNPLGPICTAASLHLAAAVPNFTWLEERHSPVENLNANDSEFYPVQPELDGCRYPVPETPGLGVEFNEELARSREFEMKEVPRLWRSDGAYTNW